MDAPNKTDRRVQRTREVLHDALANLIHERGFERLTVQNIIDRADISRATFYAHFRDKDELLAASVARLRAGLVQQWRAAQQASPGQALRLGFTLPFLQHVGHHRKIYTASADGHGEVTVERHIRAMLRSLVCEDLAAQPNAVRAGASLEMAAQYVAGALFSVVVWWLENKQPMAATEVNALFQRLTFPGLAMALGESA